MSRIRGLTPNCHSTVKGLSRICDTQLSNFLLKIIRALTFLLQYGAIVTLLGLIDQKRFQKIPPCIGGNPTSLQLPKINDVIWVEWKIAAKIPPLGQHIGWFYWEDFS